MLVFPGQVFTLPLIPTGFNTQAFDQFARSYSQPDVLERWLEAPALIIETALLDRAASIDAAGLPQDTLIASADQQSEAAINEVVAQFTRALPLLTGGQFTAFSAVSAQTTAPGAEVSSVNLGAITVVRYARGAGECRGFGQIAPNSENVVVAGRIGLEVCTTSLGPSVAAHELGHALGFGHVTAAASVMTATVTVDVTEFDRQAAAIAYQRAPGNRRHPRQRAIRTAIAENRNRCGTKAGAGVAGLPNSIDRLIRVVPGRSAIGYANIIHRLPIYWKTGREDDITPWIE